MPWAAWRGRAWGAAPRRARVHGRLRAAVTYGAFKINQDWEVYTAEYAQFIGSAVYEGERDLFVRSPDGRGASACRGRSFPLRWVKC